MTRTSQCRAAEMAVIDAAVAYINPGIDDETPSGEFFKLANTLAGRLQKAVDDYIALGLQNPGDAFANTGAPQTAHEAAEWMRKHATLLAGRVFQEIYKAHLVGAVGLTTDAVEVRLQRSHQSVSPRVTDLRNKGWVRDSGLIRQTRFGRKAVVWAPTSLALEALHQVEAWS